MAHVVVATYRCKEGEAETVLGLLEQMAPLSRKEPGCLYYRAHRSTDDPLVFFLYEQYVDQEAYEAHVSSRHFERYISGEAIPRLESRERAFFETIDA